jgi:hypothetical protein
VQTARGLTDAPRELGLDETVDVLVSAIERRRLLE